MGSFLSTSSSASSAASKRPPSKGSSARLAGSSDQAPSSFPLSLSEVEAEPAVWSQESRCVTIQRFFGLLPDSPAEELKKKQRYPHFQPRSSATLDLHLHLRADAAVKVQRVYRRYRVLTRWHDVVRPILELARSRIENRQADEEEEQITLARFRELLGAGFSAHKVSITGALKAIHLLLVVNADAGECYLTWSPSRKRQPRINLHDVEEVVPVLRTGNKHASRLASKVSHRRGLIIVCKSHHRGRVVLEMASKRERNLLLCGFERLLEEINRLEPTLDDAGALRKRRPRHQSVIEFFDPEIRLPALTVAGSDPMETSLATSPLSRYGSAKAPSDKPASPTATARRNSTTMQQLYSTRFDSASGTSTQLRRPSAVAAVPART